MTVYILILLLIVFANIVSGNARNKKVDSILIVFLTLILVSIQGLRSFNVGVDLQTYQYYFNNQIDLSFFPIQSEVLYSLLNNFISSLGLSFRFFLFIVSIIVIVPVTYSSYKYSKMPFLSVFVFVTIGFFGFSLSGLAQAIAIGITLLSIIFVKSRKPLYFVFLIIIAGLFHKSAFLGIFIYPIFYWKISKTIVPFVLFGIVLTYLLRKPIFDFLYVFYDSSYTPTDTNSYGFLFFLLILWIGSMIWFKNIRGTDTAGFTNLLLVAVYIQIFATYHPFVMRLGYYYYVYLIFLIPEFLSTFRRKNTRTLIEIIFIITFGAYFVLNLLENVMRIYPFTFL